jgi:hypothetical protein
VTDAEKLAALNRAAAHLAGALQSARSAVINMERADIKSWPHVVGSDATSELETLQAMVDDAIADIEKGQP